MIGRRSALGRARRRAWYLAGLMTSVEGHREMDAGRKNLALLVQLRWIAVCGQIVTLLVVSVQLDIDLPWQPMSAVLVALVGLNLASLVRLARPGFITNAELFTALLFDVAALTLQFYLAGGATNPFTFLYLLQVTLGAMLLDAWSIWTMVAVTGVCFSVLTVLYRPLDLSSLPGRSLFALHIDGMLVCFVLDAVLLVIFVTRIIDNLREQDARLADLRQHAAEEDHIVRMGLLASGAAHELGTPLSTLSVILGDWRRMPSLLADKELTAEIEAMDAEVRRCKAIVTSILMSAGETRGESATITTLLSFLEDVVEEWREARSATTLRYVNLVVEDVPIVSDTALKQVIFNVLDNAHEASPDWLSFDVTIEEGRLVLSVIDVGGGFPAGILESIGKPYQSSKGRIGGGLGLFLVFNVVRKLGGDATARNRSNGGAIVTLSLPLSALCIGRHGG